MLLFASSSLAQNQFLFPPWPIPIGRDRPDMVLGTNGKLAFVNSSGIVVMNPDGTSQINLISGTSPVWSPEGSRIAFEKGSFYDDSNIYVMNADGSGLKQLTFIEPGDLNAHQPAWSPDGKRIAFMLNTGPGFGSYVEFVNADTAEIIRPNVIAGCYYQGKPSWSPDGTRIAIVGRRNDKLKDCVYVMNADGSGMTCIADKARSGDNVAWSPDGSKLLYSRLGGLALINSVGGTPIQLTSGANLDYSPVWSPDGNLIAFDTDRNQLSCPTGRCSEIFLMNAGGSNQHRIASQPIVGTVYDWQSLTQRPNPPAVPATLQLDAPAYFVSANYGPAYVAVTRLGDLSGEANVDFATSDGTASSRRDYTPIFRSFRFAAGEGEKWIAIPISNNAYIQGERTVNLSLSNAQGSSFGATNSAVLTINQASAPPTSNPLGTTTFFVSQQYYDFFSRVPDQSGLNFWSRQIDSCGACETCIEAAQINVSAAFFLSIEFQQTGFLVERAYKAAYGDVNVMSALGGTHQIAVPIVRFDEFLRDTQQLGQGLVVGQSGWETVLENNKQAFMLAFVQRPRFINAYPSWMTPVQFIDALFANGGVIPTVVERQAAISEFNGAGSSADNAARARALRRVAENPALSQQEFNRAFVLMQYFGHLRRNPNESPDSDYSGYDFWLTKLNQFNGDYQKAEMVKAFINSSEYRTRFGPRSTPTPSPPCLDDSWTLTSTVSAPTARRDHTAVWTGTEMIIWGGSDRDFNGLNTGARYNPATDAWTPVSTVNAPAPRGNHSAVWTGSEMIVWGGWSKNTYFSDGARYNPSTDRWTPISGVNAPVQRTYHRAFWTGSEMIVWGGFNNITGVLNTGSKYNLSTNSWTPMSTNNAPPLNSSRSAVWTGDEMILWVGSSVGGARYNPSTDTWTTISMTNAPNQRYDYTAVWTGSEMIDWGGSTSNDLSTGGRYNPATDSWTATNTTNAPASRASHSAVWTGSEMIIWGGGGGCPDPYLNSGGRYNPATDSWIATCDRNAPVGRIGHTAIWTGREMIVWGGQESNGTRLNTGGRYSTPRAQFTAPTKAFISPSEYRNRFGP